MPVNVVVVRCFDCSLIDWGTNWNIHVGDLVCVCPRCGSEDIETWVELYE